MNKHVPSILSFFLLSLIIAVSGCVTNQYGRGGRASNTIGTAGTAEIQKLGSPRKNITLGKRSVSGEFVIVIPQAEKIYLGTEYKDVIPNGEFVDGRNDYVVLTCYESSTSFKNVLLTIPAAPALARILPLYGASNKPFSFDINGKQARLLQETNNPNIKNTWNIISTNDVQGPIPLTEKELQKEKNAQDKHKK